MNSTQVIHDLVGLLSEGQILEYSRSIGLDKLHPRLGERFERFEQDLGYITEQSDPGKLDVMREALVDFLLNDAIPSIGGIRFQDQVSKWLKRKDEEITIGELVRGTLTFPKYVDVDVHVVKKGFFSRKDVMVEVKIPKVSKKMVQKLLRNATDLHTAHDKGTTPWSPDLLMMVSMNGFTKPALDLADLNDVYCVHYNVGRHSLKPQGGRRYMFVGKMSEQDYDRAIPSKYPLNR